MNSHPTRLWDKGLPLDELIHRFTVGDDPILDLEIVGDDCVGSAAQAHTLARLGILSGEELSALLAALKEITTIHERGEFTIPPQLEDCHTAIESHLTQRCGDAGLKIHTGRSRNDQVATAMRLYLRRQTKQLLSRLTEFSDALLTRIASDGQIAMPGYTHMQPAMPSSVGQWLHAFWEAAAAQFDAGEHVLARLDSCPLGSGAGFGVPLDLDRAFTARILGFSKPQRSPIDVQNSRGLTELYFTRFATDIGRLLEKLACDLMLFTTAEYAFFRLPENVTTGSSIMPQKRNPDVLELMRAKAARLRSRCVELEWVSGKLPSSYHRDLQLTKEPTIRAAREIGELLDVARHVLVGLQIDADKLRAAMRPELYATRVALDRAQAGTPFRQAYREVATELRENRLDVAALIGKPDAAAVLSESQIAELRSEARERATRLAAMLEHESRVRASIFEQPPRGA
ncbi:MAG: argininosuccinate lyase [Phycisphaerae bacterium]